MSEAYRILPNQYGVTIVRRTGNETMAIKTGLSDIRAARQWLRDNTDCSDPDHAYIDPGPLGPRRPRRTKPYRDPHAYLDEL